MVHTVRKIHEEAHSDGIWSVDFTHDNRIITGSVDELLKIWTSDLTLTSTLTSHKLGIISTVSHGSTMCSSSLDSQIKIWDLLSNSVVRTIEAGPVKSWTVAMAPDARYLATGAHDGAINTFVVESGLKDRVLETMGSFIMSVAYSPDGMLVAGGAEDGEIHVFDVATGKKLHSLRGHSLAIRSICFTPDSQHLVSASDDKKVNIYVSTLNGHQAWVTAVDVASSGVEFATASCDKKVKVWDLKNRVCIATLDPHTDQVWAVKYSDDAKNLVSAGDDCRLVLYNC